MHFDPRGRSSTPSVNGIPVFVPPTFESDEPWFVAEAVDLEYCIPLDEPVDPELECLLENDSIGGC